MCNPALHMLMYVQTYAFPMCLASPVLKGYQRAMHMYEVCTKKKVCENL